MNSRNRVIHAIERKPVDRAPFSFDLTSRATGVLADYYHIPHEEVHAWMGDDLLYIGGTPRGTDSCFQEGKLYRDEFGVVWDRSAVQHDIGDWGGIVSVPLKEPSLSGYHFPDGSLPGRFDHIQPQELVKQGRFVILAMTGLFDICWFLRGFENFLADMLLEEDFACRLLDQALDFNLGVLEQVPAAIDGVRFGEDWGLQKGMIMGPVVWRKYLKPRLKRMYSAARAKGLKVFIHSCGDIHEIFPDLIEIGVDVVNPVQPEAMDVAMLKREYGHSVTLYGGLGCQSTLVYGTVGDVIREAENRLEILGAGGGYILGPAGAVPTDAKHENIIALAEFARSGYKLFRLG